MVGSGILLVSAAGAAAFALCASWSVGDDVTGQVLRAVADFLPAVAFFGALAVVVFAVVPRWAPAVWLVYAAGVLIAYLADPLDLATAVRVLSPFHLIGSPPVDPVAAGHVVLLCVLALAGLVIGYAGFRRRDVPQG